MSESRTARRVTHDDIVPLWRTTSEQMHFSAWASGLAAEGSVREEGGFSGFVDSGLKQDEAPSEDQDADIFSVAYKKGWEDGQDAIAAEQISANGENQALADAISHLNDLSSPDSFAFILTAVESLFRRCAELAVPDPDLLQAWAKHLAELVDQDQKGATLVMHPDDVSLIDSSKCKLAIRSDESMLRGNLKLRHSGGWIEKGSEVVLDELRSLVDEFSGVGPKTGHD